MISSFSSPCAITHLHSFPTRRSSDLPDQHVDLVVCKITDKVPHVAHLVLGVLGIVVNSPLGNIGPVHNLHSRALRPVITTDADQLKQGTGTVVEPRFTARFN